VTELLLRAFLEGTGVPVGEVEQVPIEGSGLVSALPSGQVDAIGQFVVGRSLVEAAGGGWGGNAPYDVVRPGLYGGDPAEK